MFVIILVSIAKHKRHQGKNAMGKSDYKHFKESLVIALSLAVVFGLGWGFGLLASSYPIEAVTITFQVIFSVFVGAQGILLFLLHGIRNSDARHVWKNWLTSVSSTTRLSYFVSSNNKVSGIKTPGSNISLTGMPRTQPCKVDLSKTEASMENEPVYHEIGEDVKVDISKQPNTYEEVPAEYSLSENVSYGLLKQKCSEDVCQDAFDHYECVDIII